MVPWSPLARGFLAGNRRSSDKGETARAQTDKIAHELYYRDADFRIVDRVVALAGQKGVKPAQIALAWLLHQPGVTAPIVGATKMEQLDQAIAALDITLSEEECRNLEELLRAAPGAGIRRCTAIVLIPWTVLVMDPWLSAGILAAASLSLTYAQYAASRLEIHADATESTGPRIRTSSIRVPQRNHRIHARGTAGRDVGGDGRDERQDQGGNDQNRRIGRRQPEQQALDSAVCSSARAGTPTARPAATSEQRLPQHHPSDRPPFRAERHTNPDFRRFGE